eukprot:232948_1
MVFGRKQSITTDNCSKDIITEGPLSTRSVPCSIRSVSEVAVAYATTREENLKRLSDHQLHKPPTSGRLIPNERSHFARERTLAIFFSILGIIDTASDVFVAVLLYRSQTIHLFALVVAFLALYPIMFFIGSCSITSVFATPLCLLPCVGIKSDTFRTRNQMTRFIFEAGPQSLIQMYTIMDIPVNIELIQVFYISFGLSIFYSCLVLARRIVQMTDLKRTFWRTSVIIFVLSSLIGRVTAVSLAIKAFGFHGFIAIACIVAVRTIVAIWRLYNVHNLFHLKKRADLLSGVIICGLLAPVLEFLPIIEAEIALENAKSRSGSRRFGIQIDNLRSSSSIAGQKIDSSPTISPKDSPEIVGVPCPGRKSKPLLSFEFFQIDSQKDTDLNLDPRNILFRFSPSNPMTWLTVLTFFEITAMLILGGYNEDGILRNHKLFVWILLAAAGEVAKLIVLAMLDTHFRYK